jgi:hypothetical protein
MDKYNKEHVFEHSDGELIDENGNPTGESIFSDDIDGEIDDAWHREMAILLAADRKKRGIVDEEDDEEDEQ